jgi:alginate O-acetyltransferase complex protein AlgI
MLFIEPRFFIFFIIVFICYWSSKSNLYRKIILLAASYAFYAAWDYRFLSLIVMSTIVDYFSAIRIQKAASSKHRTYWLMLSLVVNLGTLFIFKYFNFFSQSLADLMSNMGIEVGYNTLNIILPVGISFYTFQTLSYTIDVYRKHIKPRTSIIDVAVFVAFFPQLVAGPIVRAVEFIPQLDTIRHFSKVPIKACMTLFLIGYLKKAGISDNIAPYVDMVFGDPGSYDTGAIRSAVLLYATQIYCDFSGYSDMAIATAGLLGYRLPLNFASPYFAHNLSEFWRRWHISLSSWLRDYLYISIGGNRAGELKTYRNLMITMLLGGLWHGASWNFIAWGALHGGGLSAHRIIRKYRSTTKPWKPYLYGISIAVTFYLVCLAWIFFRAQDMHDSLVVAKVWLFGGSAGSNSIPYGDWVYFVPIVVVLHWLFYKVDVLAWVEEHVTWPVFSFVYGILFSIALALIPIGYRPFIYFQF